MNYTFEANNTIKIEFAFEDENTDKFFKAKQGEIYPLLNENKILLGLGKKDDFDKDILQEAVVALGRSLFEKDIESIEFSDDTLGLENLTYLLSLVEALEVSSYSFDYYKEEKEKSALKNISFPEKFKSYQDQIQELKIVLDSQFITRDMVNTRANEMTPEIIANKAVEVLQNEDITVKVYGPEEIEEHGLTGFLEVAKGSDNPPRLIVMEYLKGKDQKPLAFVGKGLAYDSGGYSIKPSDSMNYMHSDMAGSATVIGAMRAIAKNKLKVNVIGVVATCENLISGGAYKPGDMITARNGIKIEVDNTDAEGRITLADAVNFAQETYEPEIMVDLATLTGAILIALGETYTGIITNDQDALDQVKAASKVANEKIWELPNDKYFHKYFKSDLGGIKNAGGRLAGSITAGQFIEKFVGDTPWVHMDIAGTAYLSEPQGINPKGATGIHVKTLYQLAKSKELN